MTGPRVGRGTGAAATPADRRASAHHPGGRATTIAIVAGRPLNDIELDAYDVLPRDLASKVRVRQVRGIPGGYAGMTIGTTILLARPIDDDGTSALLAHELVHVRQWAEQGVVGFTSRYVASFGRNLSRHRRWGPAYRDIDAEQEARQETTEWLRRRARRAAERAAADDQPPDRADDRHQG